MPSTSDWSSGLACRFLADLLERTIDIVDEDAHQQAVQAFLDDLSPSLHPADCLDPSATFTVFSKIEIDEDTEAVSVAFTPEGLAYFRAWLRRRGLDQVMSMS